MKKNLLFGALMLLTVSRVGAQSAISLTENNFPILPGPFHYAVSYPKALVLPVAGANIKWDYSGLKADSIIKVSYLSHYNTPFTNSSTAIADTAIHEFLTSNSNCSEVSYYDIDKNGFFFAGNYVKFQYFSLKSYFGDPTDNITIPQQNDSVRLNIVKFPETYKTGNRYKVTKSLSFLWSVSSAGYSNAPSIKKTYYIVSDTVTGWGTLRLPDSATRSIAYPVLLVRHKIETIDSYYVNHSAANKYFLIAFGIIQGKKTIECYEYFYRAGHQEPMIGIGFGTDTTYSTPLSILFSVDSLKKQAGVENQGISITDFALYPNPASTNSVNCSFTKTGSGQWKILILNSIGQIYGSKTIEGNGKINTSLDMTDAKAGLYFADIFDENGQIIASSKLNIVR